MKKKSRKHFGGVRIQKDSWRNGVIFDGVDVEDIGRLLSFHGQLRGINAQRNPNTVQCSSNNCFEKSSSC